MDEVEPLFPIPMMRCPGVLDADMVSAAMSTILDGQVERNLRSGQLFHTMVADPKQHPVFQRMAALAMPKLIDFGQLLFGDSLEWTVKEMWTNVLERGGAQALHAHANSFASGIFYLTPSDPRCRTVFVRPPGGFDFSFRHHTRTATVNPFNAGKYIVPEANPGDLVLFPSYVYHEVPPNNGDRRVTVAFNAIPNRLDCWGYQISFAG